MDIARPSSNPPDVDCSSVVERVRAALAEGRGPSDPATREALARCLMTHDPCDCPDWCTCPQSRAAYAAPDEPLRVARLHAVVNAVCDAAPELDTAPLEHAEDALYQFLETPIENAQRPGESAHDGETRTGHRAAEWMLEARRYPYGVAWSIIEGWLRAEDPTRGRLEHTHRPYAACDCDECEALFAPIDAETRAAEDAVWERFQREHPDAEDDFRLEIQLKRLRALWADHCRAQAPAAECAAPREPIDPDTIPRRGMTADAIRAAVLAYPADRIATPAFDRMLRGEPYAAPGERNQAIFSMTSRLVEACPDATDAELVTFLEPTFAAGDQGADRERDGVAEKVHRHRRERAESDAMRAVLTGAMRPEREPAAPSATAAREAEAPATFPTLGPNGKGAYMRIRDEFYAQNADGTFDPRVYNPSEAYVQIADIIPWALGPGGVELYKQTNKGPVRKTRDDLFREIALPLRRPVTFTMIPGERGGVHDGELRISTVRPHGLEPEFSPAVDGWLRAYAQGGYELLADWLAVLSRVNAPAPALVSVGANGVGKALLARGCAQVFGRDQFVDFDRLTGDFADELVEHGPLIVADEKLPDKAGGIDSVEYIKRLLTNEWHSVNRKSASVVQVHGFPRMYVTANNAARLFRVEDDHVHSRAALSERLLVVPAHTAGGEYLRAIGGWDTTTKWLADRTIARHILYLAKHRTLARPGARMLLKGNGDEFVEEAATNSGPTNAVLEALVQVLSCPSRPAWAKRFRAYVRRDVGRLLVSPSLFRDHEAWTAMVPASRGVLNDRQLGTALGANAVKDAPAPRIRVEYEGSVGQATFYEIDTSKVRRFALRHGAGDLDAIEKTLRGEEVPPPARAASPFFN